MSDEREEGSISWFNVGKGFGFIVRGNGDEVFFHLSELRSDNCFELSEGDKVEYTLKQSESGIRAVDIETL